MPCASLCIVLQRKERDVGSGISSLMSPRAALNNTTKIDDDRLKTGGAIEGARRDETLHLFAEELSIAKETPEIRCVRVATRTHEREARVDENLGRERVQIATVPIGRRIDAHAEAVEAKLDAVPLAAMQQVAVPPRLAQERNDILRRAEEQLEVGKQMVESGRTRVRRFVTQRPVGMRKSCAESSTAGPGKTPQGLDVNRSRGVVTAW